MEGTSEMGVNHFCEAAAEVLLTAEAALPCSQCNVMPDSSGFATSYRATSTATGQN